MHVNVLPVTVQARHPAVPLKATFVQLWQTPAITPYPYAHKVQAETVHCRQLAAHATQADPESLYPVPHTVQALVEVQVVQPVEQATQVL